MRGFVVIFEQRKTWRLGLQEGNSSTAEVWSPWKTRKGEMGDLEDLEDKVCTQLILGLEKRIHNFPVQCSTS